MMDKNWMWLSNRLSKEFRDGVKSFIKIAEKNLDQDGKIRCPCRDCLNTRSFNVKTVASHLILKGFSKSYKKWTLHGEQLEIGSGSANLNEDTNQIGNDDDDDDGDDDDSDDDGCLEMLSDMCGKMDMNIDTSLAESNNVEIGNIFHEFEKLFDTAKQEAYPGCSKYSTLTCIVKLMHIKVLNHWSDKSFDMLLQFLKDLLPEGSNIPTSYYEAKKMLRDLGMGYESIHACENDCVLFWKKNVDADKCPVCDESRYKFDNGKGKKTPKKVLRYFPLTPRLQRLFMSRHTASDMRWHKDKRVETEGILRHPADCEGWKDFDNQYPYFAQDPRNVRLGLATDGFNPFGNMSNAYSTWPVMLVPYNLPPWKCMKTPFTMMSLLIPGPKAPGRDIDVYLQPLIEELKELWTNGIDTYDVSKKETFRLHACVLWTVNDFPAYGNLSGWSTKGYKACPVCNKDTSSQPLINKICYMGHRRFLPSRHRWRNSLEFNGKPEKDPAPKVLSGDEILKQLECVEHVQFGKNPKCSCRKRKHSFEDLNWTKKSIFFELEYWSKLKLRHNLDVMHIEKNICDSIIGTLLNIEGKTKDTIKARKDLEKMNIRTELHLIPDGPRFLKPHACYTLALAERKDFCRFLKSVKSPDGYASNISRNVSSVHRGGSKSHAQHLNEMTETLGESPGLIALFRKMFWSEAKGWSSMEAKAKYDQMIDMKENSNTEENVEPLTDNQICEIVLGKKSNFVKKMIGPSKLTSNVALSQQNQEMAKTIEEQAKKIEEQDNRLQVVEDFIKFMKEQPSFSLTPSVDPALFDSQSQ